MNRYIEFNPLKFLAEMPTWEEELKSLRENLEEILELRGQSDSVGKGSEVSNPTETINIAKAEIEEKISRLENYQYVFKNAWKMLTAEEQLMIDGFFYKKYGPVRVFVKAYSENHNTGKSYVYNARKDAIKRFTQIVNENFV